MTAGWRAGDVEVRPFREGDAPRLLAAVRASVGSLSHWFEWCGPDYGAAQAESRIAFCRAAWERRSEFPFGVFGRDGSELLGCIGLNHLNHQHRSANLGYWVSEGHRDRGLATRAARLVAAFGFRELGLVRLEVVALPQNAASMRVAEKLGATREVEARNRVIFHGQPAAAIVFSLIPSDLAGATGT